MSLVVESFPIGKKLHQLDIRSDDVLIGEYERSQEADIARKTEEIARAIELLLAVYAKHGRFKVRWSGARREKIIYVDGIERGVIPKEHWCKPSWS